MFELLLQADRALADGSLDSAERTYWQLIDLDPTNAIAVAGLARVALERGNDQQAHDFAERALAIDPESIAARRIIETLSHTGAELDETEPAVLPLLAAERLEALSRRRPQGGEAAKPRDEAAADVPAHVTPTPASPAPSKKAGAAGTVAKPAPARTAAAAGKPAAGDKTSRARTGVDRVGPPSEPMRERKAGRLAAAAAAAAAAAHEPARPRHEPHHAMPIGRRFFGPDDLKSPVTDDFSAAEMAAAIEAIDALDEPGVVEALVDSDRAAVWQSGSESEPETEAGGGFDDQADLLGAVDATAADESIALRLALVGNSIDLDAAEREAAEGADQDASDAFEAAEAMASSALHAWDVAPVDNRPYSGGFEATRIEASEFDAAEAEAARYAAAHRSGPSEGADEFAAAEADAARILALESIEPGEAGEYAAPVETAYESDSEDSLAVAEAAEADAAEAAAVAEALRQVSADEAAVEPEAALGPEDESELEREPEPEPVSTARASSIHPGGEEPSEEEAETQALREALALVLKGDGEGDAEDIEAALMRRRAAESATPAPAQPVPAEPVPAEPAPAAEPPTAPGAETEPAPRKGGLFHRIRGN